MEEIVVAAPYSHSIPEDLPLLPSLSGALRLGFFWGFYCSLSFFSLPATEARFFSVVGALVVGQRLLARRSVPPCLPRASCLEIPLPLVTSLPLRSSIDHRHLSSMCLDSASLFRSYSLPFDRDFLRLLALVRVVSSDPTCLPSFLVFPAEFRDA